MSGQQNEDGECDPAELEERSRNGGVPSAQRYGRQFPGAVGEIDFAEDGISLQDGLFPIEEMIGAVLDGQFHADGKGIRCDIGQYRGDVAGNRDETPEGLPFVDGLSCHQLQPLRTDRIGAAQDDPS